MIIFASESELLEVLDRADAMIAACVDGTLEFRSFYAQLGHLHSYHALDGHESDEEEIAVLDRHRVRIEWIERVLEEVGEVCADEDATKEAYIKAGRFGSAEALRRLRTLVENRKNEKA
jgi:hypothetical protein